MSARHPPVSLQTATLLITPFDRSSMEQRNSSKPALSCARNNHPTKKRKRHVGIDFLDAPVIYKALMEGSTSHGPPRPPPMFQGALLAQSRPSVLRGLKETMLPTMMPGSLASAAHPSDHWCFMGNSNRKMMG